MPRADARLCFQGPAPRGFVVQDEHFQYQVDLTGQYSSGGIDGCAPPDFDQPAFPRDGSATATLSFDTPSNADGAAPQRSAAAPGREVGVLEPRLGVGQQLS